MRKVLLFGLFAGVSAVAFAAGEDQALYRYAWRIVNFIAAVASIWLIGQAIWATADLDERGDKLKSSLIRLVILGCIWAGAAFILGQGASSGTAIQGVGEAIRTR